MCQSTICAHHNILDLGDLLHQLHLVQLNIAIEAGLALVIKFLLLEGSFKVGHSLQEFLKTNRISFQVLFVPREGLILQ